MASLKNRHNIKIEQDIEKFIKAEAFKNQLRIKDFFEDYDKLRKGYITEDKVNKRFKGIVQNWIIEFETSSR